VPAACPEGSSKVVTDQLRSYPAAKTAFFPDSFEVLRYGKMVWLPMILTIFGIISEIAVNLFFSLK
jgi:hypothetical protein